MPSTTTVVSVEPLRGHYDDGYLSILCPEDGYLFGNTVPPAAAVGRDVEAVAAVAERDTGAPPRTSLTGSARSVTAT